MLRSLFAQIVSLAVVVAICVGWWLSAGGDFAVMLNQLVGLAMFLGGLFEPIVSGIFQSASG
jgi:type IV secretory pathway VirB2 component (pilin)